MISALRWVARVGHFNISFIAKATFQERVHKPQVLKEEGERKRTDIRLLTCLLPFRQAKLVCAKISRVFAQHAYAV